MNTYIIIIFSCSVNLSHVVMAVNHNMVLRSTTAAENENGRRLQVDGVGQVSRFRLINATVGNIGQVLIDPIINGSSVHLANYPTNQQFSIEAITTTSNVGSPVGSVRFSFANTTNFRTESSAPFSLCGDVVTRNSFQPCTGLVVAGTYTVVATPYSLVKATGVMGQKSTVTFRIVKNVLTLAPTATPTAAPTETPSAAPTIDLPAKWIEVDPNAPIDARHEACFVMVGRKAYLLIGRGRKPVNIYDPITRTWSNGTAPPIQMHHTQCVAVDTSIWIVSSWTGGYPMERNTDKIYIYSTITNTWSTKLGLPEARRRGGAAAVLVGDKIYVSHGNRGGHETGNHSISLGWLDYYDISEDKWYTNLTDAPNPRDHAGGGLVNGRICVAGGRDGGDINFFSKVILPTDCYDPNTDTWSVEADIPAGRGGSSYGTTCDGKLMVAGGEGGSRTANKTAWANVDVFDGKSWTTISNLNIARHGSGLAVDCVCRQIYIASGARTQGGGSEIKSVETLFPNGMNVPCIA